MKFITHEDAYEVSTKNHNKVTIPAKTLEFPQIESLEEGITFCGGEEKAVDLLNDVFYSRAKNGALALVRNAASDAKMPEVIEKATRYSKTYDPSQERVGKAVLLEGVDKIRELGKEGLAKLSQEELLAMLESNFKL